jgi:hypothetical protein
MLGDTEIQGYEWQAAIKVATLRWEVGEPQPPQRRNVGGSQKKRWTLGENFVLSVAVNQLGQKNWRQVASNIAGRSPKQCRERWLGYFAPGMVRDAWTPAEDAVLVQRHSQFGNLWSTIRQFLPGHNTTAIKNRWQWPFRRNVPNHSIEFCELTYEHQMKQGALCDAAKSDWGGDKFESDIQFSCPPDPALRSNSE